VSQADEVRRRRNQAKHWNARQAAAKTPQEVVAVWYDACRTSARQAEKNGDPQCWAKLANALHDFYREHAQ
jgi:hypothetical protein